VKRLLILRFSLLVFAIISQSYLIYIIRNDPGDDLFFGEIIAILILIYTSTVISFGIRNFLRIWNRQKKSVNTLEILESDLNSMKERLTLVDSEIRKQVGVWLHGSVQSKLMKISRELRFYNLSDIADEVDDFSENEIRNYAHRLFPPALNISLEAGLVDLVGENVDLVLGETLSEQSMAAGQSLQNDDRALAVARSKRLVLPPGLAYAIYRVIEEGLNNANKKPDVSKIKVAVEAVGHSIEITVEDNGQKLSGSVTPGLGLTLFDVYSSSFGGRFSLENTQDGVVMRMVLMFTPVTVEEAVSQKAKESRSGTRSE
jgi:glucose-6-phosphate-specific signal transduction histidine kinase